MAKQKIFTPTDRQNILRETLESDQRAVMKKEMDKLLKEPDFYDNCPYCHELAQFKNDENAKHEKIRGVDCLIIKCPKCGKDTYHMLKIVKNGSMLTGITYDPATNVITKEMATLEPEEPNQKLIKVKFEPKGEN